MKLTGGDNEKATLLARLVGSAPSAIGRDSGSVRPSIWQRLNMERVARRLIQTARLAAGEHAMARLGDRIARSSNRAPVATSEPRPQDPSGV